MHGSALANLTIANGSTVELAVPLALRALKVEARAAMVGRSLDLDVSGDVIIAESASLNADGLGAPGGSPGYNNATGLGPGGSGSLGGSGGGHGGRGLVSWVEVPIFYTTAKHYPHVLSYNATASGGHPYFTRPPPATH